MKKISEGYGMVTAGWRRGKEKKAIRSITAVSLLLLISIMGTWLVSMVSLTAVTAQGMYDVLYEKSRDYSNDIAQYGRLHEFYDDSFRDGHRYERPDHLEHQMFSAIGNNSAVSYYTGGPYNYNHHTGKERNRLIRNISFPMETAVLFYDAEGRLLYSSENDVMYFNYYTQEEWDAGMDTASGLHYGWIDISEGKNEENREDDPYLRFRTMYADTRNMRDIAVLRVTGYFEGTELIPVVMHDITETMLLSVVKSDDRFSTGSGSYSYIISDVDRTGRLEWQLQFDRSAEYQGKDLVTVYLTYPKMWDYQGKPIVYDGQDYESLAVLTEAMEFPLKDSGVYNGNSIFKLNEILVFDRWVGEAYNATGEITTDFYLITAIRSKPLAYAISALRNIYIVTGLLALVLVLLVRSVVKKHLIQPVVDIANAMEDGWHHMYHSEIAPTIWYEAEKLSAGYASERDRRSMKDNEITRLNAALEYAETAEQNRRQMTSNIAHELKTPLAVIHSYAEGLKEHIAEDKRDKYVDVILAEAERTDSMVLEMLDLSRLEAGKVKLSRDAFSLVDLTKSIFEKLEMAVQEKELQISCEFPEQCTMIADENRIGQVVENFATNAVKYTPFGGRIMVRIQNKHAQTVFSIENDSEPLSAEALAKVWDTFYRADESRSGGGTGLGLAIAKNIVELHGGECSVRNTKTGVEFRFSI